MTGMGFDVVEWSRSTTPSRPVALRMTTLIAVLADSTGCVCVSLSASRIDSTTIRVTFDVPVVASAWLTSPINWRVRPETSGPPSLTVHQVIAEPVADPTYVDLVTDEQRTGVSYVVEALTLEAA